MKIQNDSGINLTFTEIIQVEALAPFNFDLTARIFSFGDKQIRSFENGQLRQVLRINSKLVHVKLTSVGTVEQPKIDVEIKSNSPITSQDKQETEEEIKFIFNLDFDLCSFYSEIKSEPVLNSLALKLYGLKNPTTPTVFEALLDSIVEQQISLKVAHTIEERLVKKFGETLTLDDETHYTYPAPQNIAVAKIGELRGCGLSERKAQYLQNAAQLIVDGKLNLEDLKNKKNSEEILLELDAIRGIGIWTAELTMLRGMQKLDALPADDLGVRRVISNYYCGGKPLKTEEARKIAQSWGRWKGLAAFYLIMAGIKGIKA
jgi:DNA-3-methyladenine glycosylase II